MQLRFFILLVLGAMAQSACVGKHKQPRNVRNILLISMDTLRADHLSSYGYHRQTSPNIDRLAEGGVRFADVSSTSAWTTPAHASLFTSLYPSEAGIVRFDGVNKLPRLSDSHTTLAELLRENGYRTEAFTGGGFVSKRLGLDQGFDVYREAANLSDYRDDLLTWLRTYDSEQPFFLFVHFYDCHRAYTPPPPYDRKFAEGYAGDYQIRGYCRGGLDNPNRMPRDPKDMEYVISQYDGEIAYADAQLAEIFAMLDKRGFAENTLTIFTSDHGEEFGEHGDCDHIRSLYQELIAVPLIIKGPKIPAGKVIDAAVSIIDIAPTVLEFVDIPIPDAMRGKSLVPMTRGLIDNRPYQLFETAFDITQLTGIRANRWKLIVDGKHRPQGLYDLRADPGEKTDKSKTNRVTFDYLHGLYQNWQQSLNAPASPPETVDAPPALKESLRSLGYAQ